MRTPSGHSPPVRVSPARLRHSGGDLRLLGQDLADETRRQGPWLAGAAAGCPGWGAADAAVEAALAWQDLLRGLAEQVGGLGQAFVAAAEAYTACDERAAGGAVPR